MAKKKATKKQDSGARLQASGKAKRSLYSTKGFWSGVLVIAAGVVIDGYFNGDWDAALQKVLAGFALIAGRDALRKLEA